MCLWKARVLPGRAVDRTSSHGQVLKTTQIFLSESAFLFPFFSPFLPFFWLVKHLLYFINVDWRMEIQVLPMGISTNSWVLWKLMKSWINRLHKESRKAGKAGPHKAQEGSGWLLGTPHPHICPPPCPHTPPGTPASERYKYLFTLYSPFPTVLLLSLSAYLCVLLFSLLLILSIFFQFQFLGKAWLAT